MARTDMAIHTRVHQNPAGGKSGICNKSLDRSCIQKKVLPGQQTLLTR